MTKTPYRRLHAGQHYIDFLAKFALAGDAASYFEIGVNLGKSLRRINLPSVGVDPKFIFRGDVMAGKPEMHLFQTTSDDFFAKHSLFTFFKKGVDIAFLDGMHLIEFLLRDFINTERCMATGGTIFMHDCLPINAEMAERDRRPELRTDLEYKAHWTGDVWKIIPILKKYRPDLDVRYLDCMPTGLVMIRGMRADSKTLADRYDEIVREWVPVELDDESLRALYAEIDLTAAETAT